MRSTRLFAPVGAVVMISVLSVSCGAQRTVPVGGRRWSAPPLGYTIQCGGRQRDLASLLPRLYEPLTGVPYVYGKTDCSHMYHRLLVELEKECEGYRAPDYRPSRALAKRLHATGALVQIRDARRQADQIKAGSVAFFGKAGHDYSRAVPEQLFNPNGGIKHVAVIVNVIRREGRPVRYQMFHGRRPGRRSGVTTHRVTEHDARGRRVPYFGNGSQPLVAIAPVGR